MAHGLVVRACVSGGRTPGFREAAGFAKRVLREARAGHGNIHRQVRDRRATYCFQTFLRDTIFPGTRNAGWFHGRLGLSDPDAGFSGSKMAPTFLPDSPPGCHAADKMAAQTPNRCAGHRPPRRAIDPDHGKKIRAREARRQKNARNFRASCWGCPASDDRDFPRISPSAAQIGARSEQPSGSPTKFFRSRHSSRSAIRTSTGKGRTQQSEDVFSSGGQGR